MVDWIKGGTQGLWEAKALLLLTLHAYSRTLGYLISSIGLAVWDRHAELVDENDLGSGSGPISQG